MGMGCYFLFLCCNIVWILFCGSIDAAPSVLNITCTPHPALQRLVSRNHTHSLLYIITHDNKSDQLANFYVNCLQGKDWIRIARSPVSVYFESLLYATVFPSHQDTWLQYDYVITSTYKTLTRSLMPRILPSQSFANIHDLLVEARRNDYDVVPFLRQNKNMFLYAVKHHKNKFRIAWNSLLYAMGYSISDINRYSNVFGFYRNVFVIKTRVFQKLTVFMSQAVQTVNSSIALQNLMGQDAHYVLGKPNVAMSVFGTHYYQLYPFIFERLPIFFLNSINATICMHESGPCKFNYKA
jgi:hypothetical protein